jgi:DNA-binding HxlR family transcriptional regulator
MHERKIPLYKGCGYSLTMQIIGGKWKICIIDALRDGPVRPSALFKAIPDATERVINQQIKELLEHKIIDRTIFPEQPPVRNTS